MTSHSGYARVSLFTVQADQTLEARRQKRLRNREFRERQRERTLERRKARREKDERLIACY